MSNEDDLMYEQQFDDISNQYGIDLAEAGNFYENLAHYMDEGELLKIGADLTEKIEDDDGARQGWVRVNVEGFELLGIGNTKSRSAYTGKTDELFGFTLLKSALHATAEIHSNIFPATGFVQMECLGEIDENLEKHADRIKELMNYVLTDVMEEYKPNKKQGIFWMVLEGSMFTKVFIDHGKGRPSAPFIRASDIIIDPNATSLEDAERISHYFSISDRAAQDLFDSGQWRQAHLEIGDLQSNRVQQKIEQKIGVVSSTDDYSNKYYELYETAVYLDLDGFESGNNGQQKGRALPYLVTKDKNSSSIVSIVRNWQQDDPLFRPIKHLIHHKYFPGLNIYGFGLFHLALGLAKAETKIQQQLIRAAELSNAPSLLQADGLRSERTQIDIKPGSINRFQTFDNNIQNAVMPLPFKEPSATLMEFRQIVSDAITALSVSREINPEISKPTCLLWPCMAF